MNMQIHVITTHCDSGAPSIYLVTTEYDEAEETYNTLVDNFIATYKTAIVKKHGPDRTEIIVKHPARCLFVDWLKGNAKIHVTIDK